MQQAVADEPQGVAGEPQGNATHLHRAISIQPVISAAVIQMAIDRFIPGLVFSIFFTTINAVNSTRAQAPVESLASTKIGSQELHLFAIAKKKPGAMNDGFNLSAVADFQHFGNRALMTQLNSEMGITPWAASPRRGRNDEFVLGFALRNADGSLSPSVLRFSSAFRAVDTIGQEHASWPRGSVSPFEDLISYQWDYELSPLVVSVPQGVQNLSKLEGFLVQTPAFRGQGVFDKAQFANATYTANSVMIVPLSMENSGSNVVCRFVFLTRKSGGQKTTANAGTGAHQRLANLKPGPSIDYVGVLPDGTKKAPTFTNQSTLSGAAEKKFMDGARRDVAKMIAEKTVPAETVAYIMKGDEAAINIAEVVFQNVADIQSVEVNYSIPVSGPVPSKFSLDNILLFETGQVQAVNDYINSLKVDVSASQSNAIRTWRDASGKFTIEAKLIDANNSEVKLEKADGQQITVPRAKLSVEDQEYLNTAEDAP